MQRNEGHALSGQQLVLLVQVQAHALFGFGVHVSEPMYSGRVMPDGLMDPAELEGLEDLKSLQSEVARSPARSTQLDFRWSHLHSRYVLYSPGDNPKPQTLNTRRNKYGGFFIFGALPVGSPQHGGVKIVLIN